MKLYCPPTPNHVLPIPRERAKPVGIDFGAPDGLNYARLKPPNLLVGFHKTQEFVSVSPRILDCELVAAGVDVVRFKKLARGRPNTRDSVAREPAFDLGCVGGRKAQPLIDGNSLYVWV